MVASLALAFAALRAGVALRRARLARRPPPRGVRRRHLLLAKPAVMFLLAGFLLGPISAVALRGWSPFATLHGLAGLVAAALFVAAAVHGRRLEAGSASARGAHALFGALALLCAAVAAMAGFVLLP
jgi:hypothetical protein